MVASMTTLMFSSCTPENIPTEKFEQTLNIGGIPISTPCLGPLLITSGKLTVKNEARIKDGGMLIIKGSIKSNDLKLVDMAGVKYESKEVISWNAKVITIGDLESASFKVKFTLKSMDQKLIKLELKVKFNPNVPNSFEVEKAEIEGTNVPCLIDGLN
jgi:hypothetical protein